MWTAFLFLKSCNITKNVIIIYNDCDWITLFYVLETSTVISGLAPTCDSVRSWWYFNAAPLGASGQDIPLSPDTEPISPFPILIILSTLLGSNKYHILSHWFESTRVWKPGFQILWSTKLNSLSHAGSFQAMFKPTTYSIAANSFRKTNT